MNTGEKIKYFRLAHGITQEQLAQDAEISHSTLRKYEANERNPKYEQLLKIADALGISVNIFTDFDIRTMSDLLSLIFKMNEQLDLQFNSEKNAQGNIIPDTLNISFQNPLINEKLSAYVTFLEQMANTEEAEYNQALTKLENQLLDDNTDIHKTPVSSSDSFHSPSFTNPTYQNLLNLLSDCSPQELEWIFKSVQLTKDCMRNKNNS